MGDHDSVAAAAAAAVDAAAGGTTAQAASHQHHHGAALPTAKDFVMEVCVPLGMRTAASSAASSAATTVSWRWGYRLVRSYDSRDATVGAARAYHTLEHITELRNHLDQIPDAQADGRHPAALDSNQTTAPAAAGAAAAAAEPPAAGGDPSSSVPCHLSAATCLQDRAAVLLAVWFHDVVYDARGSPGSNEELSAVLCEQFCDEALAEAEEEILAAAAGHQEDVSSRLAETRGRWATLRERVPRYIRDTWKHDPSDPSDGDLVLFLDADCAILGAEPARYAEYAAQVRFEYQHIPEAAFRTGRARVLEQLATGAGSGVFHSQYFHDQFDAQARANMSAEAAALTSGVGQTIPIAPTPASSANFTVLVLDDSEGLLAKSDSAEQMRHVLDSTLPHLDSSLVGQVVFRASGLPLTAAAAAGDDGAIAEFDAQLARNVRVLMCVRERTQIDAALLERLPALELILQTGGHAYHADLAALTARGIPIAMGRRVTAPLRSVSELTFALIVGAMRGFREASEATRQGSAATTWAISPGRTLYGKRLGLLGAGRHGSNVARIARAFGMEVVAWDRSLPDEHKSPTQAGPIQPGGSSQSDDADLERLALHELLSTSDVVSVHLRLSDESRHLLNKERLGWLKPGAVLVNTSRGAIIDEVALAEALDDTSAPLAAVGLDVFETEPLPADSPLRSLPNAFLTPHIGWTSEETFAEFTNVAAEQLGQYFCGKLPASDVLNPEAFELPMTRRIPGAGILLTVDDSGED